MIIIFSIGNDSNSGLLFNDKWLKSGGRGRGPNFYSINEVTAKKREVKTFEGFKWE